MAPHKNQNKKDSGDDRLRKTKKSNAGKKATNRLDSKTSSMGRRIQAVEVILGGVLVQEVIWTDRIFQAFYIDVLSGYLHLGVGRFGFPKVGFS